MRIAVGGGHRSRAYYLMIAAIAATLVTDSLYGWMLLHGTYHADGLLDGGWILYYVLLAAAALHPSMTSISQAAAPSPKLTRLRALAVGAAVLIAPVVEVVKASTVARGGSDAVIVGATAIVLFSLVVIRMIGLARDQEVTADRERAMRQAAGALVTATSPAEIVRAARDAVFMLAGRQAQPTMLEIEQRDGAGWFGRADPRCGVDGDHELPWTPLSADIVDPLVRRLPVELTDARAAFGADLGRTPAFGVPIVTQGHLAGALALLDATSVPSSTRDSLESLAAQVGLALESAVVTATAVRNVSEARLGALVQHSTDVIMVLTRDTAVEYVSPSIRQILGYDAAQFVGRMLSDYIPDADRTVVRPPSRVCSPVGGKARTNSISRSPRGWPPARHGVPGHQPARRCRRRRDRREPA